MKAFSTTQIIKIILISVFIVVSSCKNHKPGNKAIKSDATIISMTSAERDFGNEIAPTLKVILAQKDTGGRLEIAKDIKIHEANYIESIYIQNGYKPFWMADSGLNERGKELMEYYQVAPYSGLNNNLYFISRLKVMIEDISHATDKSLKDNLFAQCDIGLMYAFLMTGKHLHNGILDFDKKIIDFHFDSLQKITGNNMLKRLAGEKVEDVFLSMEPQNPNYQRLKKELAQFVKIKTLVPNNLKIRDYKADSLGAMKDVRDALVFHKYLNSYISTDDSAFIYAFKKFQKDHGLKADAVPGENTRYALTVDDYDNFQSIILCMDRWRHIDREPWPQQYIFVNIPSYELWFIGHDSLQKKHNVVVGKTGTQTPEIISKLDNIVILPSWSVPQSIIKKEMMGKINSGRMGGFQVTRHKNGWISVVQPPGKNNSLGVIKFNFLNDYSVYIHDTPSKSLFSNDTRAYSHGCVRLQNPLDFGAFILSKESIIKVTEDSLKALVDTGRSKTIKIKNNIPIFIQYFTSMVDYEGKLKFYRDIYNRNQKYIDQLFYNYDNSWINAARSSS